MNWIDYPLNITYKRLGRLARFRAFQRKFLIPSLIVLTIATPLIIYQILNQQAQASWYNDSWSYRKKITVDNTKVTGNTIEVRVDTSSDDAEECLNDNSVNLTSTDIEIIDDGACTGGSQEVGLRFQNVEIPQGITVTNAYVQFAVDEFHSGSTSTVVYAEDTDDASTFTTTSSDISGRTKTSASVAWNNIPEWQAPGGTAGPDQRTPDISTVIQEVIDRGGWSSGNDIAIILAGGSGVRVAESQDGDNPAAAPLLHIEYVLQDFPVLIETTDPDLANLARSDGFDILFTDADQNKLDHEIESYDSSTGTLTAWVEFSNLYPNSDTEIYMYYGNPSASDQQNISGTWNSNYLGVYHMDEDSGTALNDSATSGSTDNATKESASEPNPTTSGQIDDAQDFTAPDYATITGLFGSPTDVTVQAWVDVDSRDASGANIVTIGDVIILDAAITGENSEVTAYFHHSGGWNGTITDTDIRGTGWRHVAYTFDDSEDQQLLYIDGTEASTGGNGYTQSIDYTGQGSNTEIGRHGNGNTNYDFDGRIDEVRILNIPQSAGWLETEYANQSAPSSFYTIGEQEGKERPALHWKFNEGQGTIANDSSTFANTGTISGATWQQKELCAKEQCLSFDGNNDSVSITDQVELDASDDQGFTIYGWFRHATSTSGTDVIVSKFESTGADGGYKLYMDDDGDIVCGIDDDNTSFPEDSAATTTANYDDNAWHHAACVKEGTSSLTLYIDGKQVAQDSSISSTGTLANNDSFYAGIDGDGTSNPWAGFLDDIKIYRTAHTTEQVQAEYNQGASILGSKSANILSNGLVGYWKLDEASGDATDSSGNNATLTNTNTTAYAAGKFGNAADYESGSSNYHTVADTTLLSITSDLTISGWINPESTTASTQFTIAAKTNSYSLAQYGDEIRLYLNGSSIYTETTGSNLSTSTWYYVTATYDASEQDIKIYINGEEQAVSTTGTIPTSITDNSSAFNIGAEVLGTGGSESVQVAASSDDGFQNTNTLGGDITEIYITFGFSDTGNPGISGVRFQNVDVAQGSTISSATLTLLGQDTYDCGGCTLQAIVYGEDVDNSSTFTTTDGNIANRTKTTANSGNISKTSNTAEVPLEIDVTSAVQEIINRGGWSANNAMSLLIEDNGSDESEWQQFYSYDNDTAKAAQLDIEFGTLSENGFYDGKIDELRVYNRTLSPNEISDLYTFAPGPLAYYDFETPNTSSVQDISGNANTATLQGGMGTGNWTQGKYGKGLDFDGSANYLEIVDPTWENNLLSYTVSMWVYFDSLNGTTDEQYRLFESLSGDSIYPRLRIFGDGDIQLQQRIDATTDTLDEESKSITAGRWHHIAAQRDGNTGEISIYVDGVRKAIKTTAGTLDGGTTNSILPADSTEVLDGKIDDVRIYNYYRTPQQIVEDMNAGHPTGGSPIGSQSHYYKFDEGYGSTANNSGNLENSVSGSITVGGSGSNTTTADAWSNNGKVKKAIDLDGTDDYISVSSPSLPTGDFTYSAWVYKRDTGNNSIFMASDGSGGNEIWITITTGSKLQVFVDNATALTTDTSISSDTWHHIMVTRSGSTVKAYINGIQDAQTGTETDTLNFGSCALLLGTDNDTSGCTDSLGDYFNGLVDEAKIYTSALSADQAKLDYNQGKSIVLGYAGTDASGNPSNAQDRTYCPPGDTTATCAPVGYWKFEEGEGTTAYDTSTTGVNGTLTNDATWTQGKVGKSVTLDGTGDNVNMGNNSAYNFTSGDFSMSVWVYPITVDNNDKILTRGEFWSDGWYWEFTNDLGGTRTLRFATNQTFNSPFTQGSTTIPLNTWTHIAMRRSGTNVDLFVNGKEETTYLQESSHVNPTTNTRSLRLGSNSAGSSNNTNALFDEVKIYDYELSNSQIAWDYNRGKPVAHYKFDECTGTTAYDASGNGLNGTITPGGSGNTSASSCTINSSIDMRYNGRVGKRNYALDFDGTNDYVTVADNNKLDVHAMTLTAWVKGDSFGTDVDENRILFKGTGSHSGNSYSLDIKDSLISFAIDGAIPDPDNDCETSEACVYGTTELQTDTWYHVTAVFDGTTGMSVYLNGKLDGSTTLSPAVNNVDPNSNALHIGGRSDSATDIFDGIIDDVRIYNYPLTEHQIKTVMNDGAIRWGPSTGAP